MRIRSIRVENFRAIRFLELKDLPNAIVVAGPNGCGKSSLFDAIRLLKSAYGQYHQNEFQSWFSEFQINIHRIQKEANRFLHNPNKPLYIKAEFEISENERTFLRNNINELVLQMTIAQHQQNHVIYGQTITNPIERRAQVPIIEAFINSLEHCIDNPIHVAQLSMDILGNVDVTPSPIVELIFSTYQPKDIGVIDYHGADRTYVREQVGGINLQIEELKQRNSQHALYNTQNKYQGVKTEMAQSFVRQLLAREAGIPIPKEDDLKLTLDELFSIFFPGKKFLGAIPTADGGLSFPVELENGSKHDINELSSGEKEVLLGYLRLRNNAPRNSIILIDEPELHLNPRLIRGLPRFYQKHLGDALGNQLLLITHSDTLLREAVDEPSYRVYHMHAAYSTPEGSNQLDSVSVSAEVERAVIDLMGDLATYSPRSKVVLLEGEDSEVDENILKELFPGFVERVNLLSVGNKRRVGAIHDILERAAQGGKLDARFYSIVDQDFGGNDLVDSHRRFCWDVYHIENYLLEPRFIQEAMRSLILGKPVPSESEILSSLKKCAEATIDNIVRIKMEQYVNGELVSCISTKFDPKTPLASGFRKVAESSFERMKKALDKLSHDFLLVEEQRIKGELTSALSDDSWRNRFRGRDKLLEFSSQYKSYD
ncbi:AAA family ATPase [Adhaeribacter rhizoryzae]|uniref:AAA family ATPase n=1 Tax=Adhaeribacter rhizoryzae TaxID=2607907 RepID=A0A5M6CUF7_9BACT|nr:ATP-binding protein [Adhaeribacter rhizoryzae]KAA5538831.1 AAA family ATPase [Adhaeribacter rhizoryzae]